MSKNKYVKTFQRALARRGLYFFSWLLKYLPYWIVRGLAVIFISIGYPFIIRHRRIAAESLMTAFGQEKTADEIKSITKKCFRNLGLAMIEMSYYLVHPENVTQMVYMDGKEHLDNALKKGKGAIVVTAHFGNFPLMMFYCALRGYKINSIIRPARDEKMEEYLLEKRTAAGINTIYEVPRQQCVSMSLEVLRKNEVLFVPLDQNSGSAGCVFVDFFGQEAATATGPVILSKRTGAPIILMFIVRQDNGMHRIIIEPETTLIDNPDNEQMLHANVHRITQIIEKYIRKYPHEWGWMHRRWKCRPTVHNTRKQRKAG